MSFTSPIFFLFLPSVLIIYYHVKSTFRLPLLLLASYLFYAFYDIRLLLLILLTTLSSYFCANYMEKTSEKKLRKKAIIINLLLCLGILFFFKYFNFSLQSLFSVLNLFDITIYFEGFDILLPMGISFYIFQTMSYTFDVYSGKIDAEKQFGYYALFVVFFPQLVAGPIERPGDLLPQLKKMPSPGKNDFSIGSLYLLRGYAKKLLVADFLSGFVNTAYEQPDTAGGAALLVATFFFAFQIYCDFSGYSDIALGCARLMGIQLSDNFRNPYSAISLQDFWRRWHISLTRWFTDYLYIPLGGNRKGLLLQYRNIIITFLVSGLWHGANLTYIVWGGIHGIYLVLETILFKNRSTMKKNVILNRCITFFLVCFTWIFFRAASLTDAITVIQSIFRDFRLDDMFLGLGASPTELVVAFLLLLVLPFIDKYVKISSFTFNQRTLFFYVILILSIFICSCYILVDHGSTSFIYFQF